MAQRQVIEEPNAEREREQLSFEDLFSLRKPRDARAGLASGLKSMGAAVQLDMSMPGCFPLLPPLPSFLKFHDSHLPARGTMLDSNSGRLSLALEALYNGSAATIAASSRVHTYARRSTAVM